MITSTNNQGFNILFSEKMALPWKVFSSPFSNLELKAIITYSNVF